MEAWFRATFLAFVWAQQDDLPGLPERGLVLEVSRRKHVCERRLAPGPQLA